MSDKHKVTLADGSEVTYSGDTRTVKHLLFPYFYEDESPMQPGVMAFFEKTAKRFDVIDVDDLRAQDLAKGERLGSFFNDEELKAIEKVQATGGDLADVNTEFSASEAGAHEIAEHIKANRLNVDETVALSGGDPATAARVLEAESLAHGGDARKGVTAGLEAVATGS